MYIGNFETYTRYSRVADEEQIKSILSTFLNIRLIIDTCFTRRK